MQPRYAPLLAIVFVVLGLASSAVGDDKTFKVIVHPKSSVTTVDRDLLRNIFLRKVLAWRGGGETARPIDLTAKVAVRDQFTRKVLKKTPAQLKTYWNQQIFSGKGVPPPEVGAPADVVTYVLAHPGAVGYVPANTDTREAKVVEVK